MANGGKHRLETTAICYRVDTSASVLQKEGFNQVITTALTRARTEEEQRGERGAGSTQAQMGGR